MDLSISIVSWNVKELLKKCLNSILENKDNLNIEIFVIDNNSRDRSPDMVKKDFPQVILIENKSNIGYAAANNKALKLSKGKYILLLNPDTEIKPKALRNMMDFMESNPNIGAIGPKLLNSDGTLQKSCVTFPTLETMLYSALFLDVLLPKSKVFGKYNMDYWDHNDLREVDQPMGAALMVRKKTIDEIGLMDEHNLFWFDEVDWCYEIKKHGWKIYYYPEAQVLHHKGQSFKKWKNPKEILKSNYLWRSARNYFFRKRYGPGSVLALYLLDTLQLFIIIFILILITRSLFYLWRLII